jgi:hypothetical protein
VSFTENSELRTENFFPGARFPTCTEPLKFEKVIGRRSAAAGAGKPSGHTEPYQGTGPKGSKETYDES